VELKDGSPSVAVGVGEHDHEYGDGKGKGKGKAHGSRNLVKRSEVLGMGGVLKDEVDGGGNGFCDIPPPTTTVGKRSVGEMLGDGSASASGIGGLLGRTEVKRAKVVGSDSEGESCRLGTVQAVEQRALSREVRLTRPWKDVYCERLVVERNWRKGRCTTKTLKVSDFNKPPNPADTWTGSHRRRHVSPISHFSDLPILSRPNYRLL
jgi:F-box/WD-40 domain protein MET30